jgi:hypothetical protein
MTRRYSRRQRIDHLYGQVDQLSWELHRSHRDEEVTKAAKALKRDPNAFAPISEEAWAVMLPDERQKNLVVHYLSLRAELVELIGSEPKTNDHDKRNSWLDGSAPKLISLASGVATILQFGYEALHAAGILAHEGQGGDDVFEGSESDRSGPII